MGSMSSSVVVVVPHGVYGTFVPRKGGMYDSRGTATFRHERSFTAFRKANGGAVSASCCCTPPLPPPPSSLGAV